MTIDDVLNVAEAAATREIQKIGGSEALDEPYMKIAFLSMIKKRAGWLVILFLGEMLTATAMGFFEHEIDRAVVLALFVPLLISSGGNSGSQASTLVGALLSVSKIERLVAVAQVLAGPHRARLGTIGFLRITIWSSLDYVWSPLDTCRSHGWSGSYWDCPLGHDLGFDAADDPPPRRL